MCFALPSLPLPQDELAAAQRQAEAETVGGPEEEGQRQQQAALEVVEAREVAGGGEQAGPTVAGSVADAEANNKEEGPGGKQGSDKK